MSTAEWREANKEKLRESRRAWYHRNKEAEIVKARERGKKRVEEIRLYLFEFKSKLGCQRCEENHPATLDLHHIDPKKKTINPSRMAQMQWGQERIDKELDNCIVLCSNCHRKEHHIGRS